MTDSERSAAEMRGLLGFARELGIEEATVREIYEAVGPESAASCVSDHDRFAGGAEADARGGAGPETKTRCGGCRRGGCKIQVISGCGLPASPR